MEYEDIFERDARWLMGQRLLTDVVKYLKGKCLVVSRIPDDPNAFNLTVPLPTIQNELTGQGASIAEMVPPDLSGIFQGCLTEAISDYLGENGRQELVQYIGEPNSMLTMSNIQASLRRLEDERRAYGNGELWWFVAKHFGMSFNPCMRVICG